MQELMQPQDLQMGNPITEMAGADTIWFGEKVIQSAWRSLPTTPYKKFLWSPSFYKRDAVSDEFGIEDKNTVKHKNALIEDTMVRTVVTIPDILNRSSPIKVVGDFFSLTQMICRLDAKSLQTKATTNKFDLCYLINWSTLSYYGTGGGDTGPISHGASTDLMEWGVQSMIGFFRANNQLSMRRLRACPTW